MDHYKSNIFLIKSPFILSQKFNNNVIVFCLKTKLPILPIILLKMTLNLIILLVSIYPRTCHENSDN